MRAARRLAWLACRDHTAPLAACVARSAAHPSRRPQFKMKIPVSIKTWGICVLMADRELRGDGPGSLQHWMQMLVTTFRELGIAVPAQPPTVHWCSRDPGRYPSYETIEPEIDAALAKHSAGLPDVLFVIIPRKGEAHWAGARRPGTRRGRVRLRARPPRALPAAASACVLVQDFRLGHSRPSRSPADPQYYKMVKGACDSQFGVISQVIVAGKASCLTDACNRGPRGYTVSNHKQYLANVGLKVNHKLGGVNCSVKGAQGRDGRWEAAWRAERSGEQRCARASCARLLLQRSSLALATSSHPRPLPGFGMFQAKNAAGAPTCPPIWNNRPTMLIGIDVSHPQSFDKSEPSMVGIVASMDRHFGQYACRIKRVGHREEVRRPRGPFCGWAVYKGGLRRSSACLRCKLSLLTPALPLSYQPSPLLLPGGGGDEGGREGAAACVPPAQQGEARGDRGLPRRRVRRRVCGRDGQGAPPRPSLSCCSAAPHHVRASACAPRTRAGRCAGRLGGVHAVQCPLLAPQAAAEPPRCAGVQRDPRGVPRDGRPVGGVLPADHLPHGAQAPHGAPVPGRRPVARQPEGQREARRVRGRRHRAAPRLRLLPQLARRHPGAPLRCARSKRRTRNSAA